jgi:hypothetical protein
MIVPGIESTASAKATRVDIKARLESDNRGRETGI